MAPSARSVLHLAVPPMPGMRMPSTMSGPMWMPDVPPTLARLLAWHPQPVPVEPAACALLLLAYGLAVVRLRRRGDRWPIGRSVAWVLGVASIAAVTCTGVGVSRAVSRVPVVPGEVGRGGWAGLVNTAGTGLGAGRGRG